MKKTYEKPVLVTEQFDVEDVITASDISNRKLTTTHDYFPVNDIPTGDITFN